MPDRPSYDYQLPLWYEDTANVLRSATNAARDAWFGYYDLDGNFHPTPAPPHAMYGDMVADAYGHGSAALQGLYEARLNGGDWKGWGPQGEGFPQAHQMALGGAGQWDPRTANPNISPALYGEDVLSPYFYPLSGLVAGTWSAPRPVVDADPSGYFNSGVARGGTQTLEYRPGDQGYWWNNVYQSGVDRANEALDAAYASAGDEVTRALARKGQLGSPGERYARLTIQKDREAFDPARYGHQAVDYFGNLIDTDLGWWDSQLQTQWARTGEGRPPAWFTPETQPSGGVTYEPGNIIGLPPMQGGFRGEWPGFSQLTNRATENYNQALDYAKGLDLDLGSLFRAALAAANRGSDRVREGIGVGAPTAYFGDLARVGGWQEGVDARELQNIHGDVSSYSGKQSKT